MNEEHESIAERITEMTGVAAHAGVDGFELQYSKQGISFDTIVFYHDTPDDEYVIAARQWLSACRRMLDLLPI
jgi:hypothetical protein